MAAPKAPRFGLDIAAIRKTRSTGNEPGNADPDREIFGLKAHAIKRSECISIIDSTFTDSQFTVTSEIQNS